MKRGYFKLLFIVCLAGIMQTTHVLGQHLFYNTPVQNDFIQGAQISATGANFDVAADYFPQTVPATNDVSWRPTTYKIMKSDALIMLRLHRPDLGYPINSFECSVNLRITYFRWNQWEVPQPTSNDIQVVNKTVKVNYDKTLGKSYKEKDFVHLEWAHYVKVEVLSVSNPSLAQYLALEADIKQDRYKPVSNTALKPAFDASFYVFSNVSNEIRLMFTTSNVSSFATEYDLEWTFIEAYSDNGQLDPRTVNPSDFRFNSSRVTIQNNYYDLVNTFEVGHLAYRVRAVGRDINTNNEVRRVECDWSDIKVIEIPPMPQTIPSTLTLFEHEADKNWQYSCSYAEGGKKKEFITYFDGSLRARQQVTQAINSTNGEKYVIVQDKIYDHQGRLAIEVLPTPIQNPRIKFYDGLSLKDAAGTVPYNRDDFDKDILVCETQTLPMKNTSGASSYYSENNVWNNAVGTNFQNYVPIASGFPFVQKVFTPDNTGRIAKQSAPGINHKIGSGHETEYIYIRPNQQELDRLFGSEVGYAEHYQKNVVIDANGQASVSYINPQGQVVATALSGKQSSNVPLVELPGAANSTYTPETAITVDLMSSSDMAYTKDGLINYYSFYVDKETDYKFYYSVLPEKYADAECVPENYCLDCIYDLEISIKNQCDEEQMSFNNAEHTLLKRKIGKQLNNANYNSCATPNDAYTFEDDYGSSTDEDGYITVHLEKGTYTISKKLTVNQDALNFYTEKYLNDQIFGGECKSLGDFQQEAMSGIDLSGCELTCDECLQNIGLTKANLTTTAIQEAKSDYVDARIEEITIKGITPTTEDTEVAERSFDFYLQNCREICAPDAADKCFTMKQIMVLDVMPGGQYAKYKKEYINGDSVIVADDDNGADNNNILGALNEVGESVDANPLSYQNAAHYPEFSYTTITVVENGIELIKPISQLTVEQFVKYFKQEWAEEILVKKHPEYCNYLKCIEEQAGEQYVLEMMTEKNYSDASIQGYIAPLRITEGEIVSDDPFFNGTCGATYRNFMYSNIQNYVVAPQYISYNLPSSTLNKSDLEVVDIDINGVKHLYDKNNPTNLIGTVSNVTKEVKSSNNISLGYYEETLLKDNTKLKRIRRTNGTRVYKMTDIPLIDLFCSDIKPNQSRLLYQCVVDARAKLNDNTYSCDDLKDRYWEMFRSLYLGSRNYYTEKSNEEGQGACECNPMVNGLSHESPIYRREKRFYPTPKGSSSELFRAADGSLINPASYPAVSTENMEAAIASANSAIENECNETCTSYAEYWMSKIEQCSTASALLSPAQKLDMIDDLIAVCRKGCDVNNPMGSTTVATKYLNDAAVVDKSFHDVFTRFLGGVYEAGICDELLIRVPKPYGHDYLSTSSPYADTCSCDQTLYGYFINQGKNCAIGSPPVADNCPCNDNANISSTVKTSLKIGKEVERAKKCQTCIGCLDLSPAVFAFKERYPELEENDPLFSTLFETYLNNNLNMNLNYTDYMSLISSCTQTHTLSGFIDFYDDIYLTVSPNLNIDGFENELWPIHNPSIMIASKDAGLVNPHHTETQIYNEQSLIIWGRKNIPEVFIKNKNFDLSLTASLLNLPISDYSSEKLVVEKTLAELNADAFAPPFPSGTSGGASTNPDQCGCNKIFDIWKQYPNATDQQLAQHFANQFNGGKLLPNFAELKKQCCRAYNGISSGIGPEELPGGTGYLDLGEDGDNVGNVGENCSVNFGSNPLSWVPNWSTTNLSILQFNLNKQKIKFPEELRCQSSLIEKVDVCGCDNLQELHKDYEALSPAEKASAGTFEEYVKTRKGISTSMPDLLSILNICNEIERGANANADPTLTTWNENKQALLEERVKMQNLKLPKEFSCQPQTISNPGGGISIGGSPPSSLCSNVYNLSCEDLKEMFESELDIKYEFMNQAQLTALRQRSEWSNLLAEFKTRIGFSNSNNCVVRIVFSQNVPRCGGERAVYENLYVPNTPSDNDLSDLISFMVSQACGCVPINSWTRLAPRVTENCTDCYGATKQLAGLQKFLNEIAISTNLTSQTEGITYTYNNFYSTSAQNIQGNSAFISDVYDGTNPSSLQYTRASAVPYLENYYRMNISDGNGYNKQLTLNFLHNATSNKIYFVRRFFNIRPSCPSPNDYFEVDVELDVYDPSVVTTTLPVKEVVTMQGNISGLTLGIAFNCCAMVCNRPANLVVGLQNETCGDELIAMAELNALNNYRNYMEEKREAFRNAYIAKCLNARQNEVFKMKYNPSEYHFTLYYYDRAGNLTKTVPPAGVRFLNNTQLDAAKTARNNYHSSPVHVRPSHTLVTYYQYNTLNQLIWQSTPDADVSQFYYDALGRIVLSQNAKQATITPNTYSYTVYDGLGRISEVGQVSSTNTITHLKSRNVSEVNLVLAGTKTMITETYYDEANELLQNTTNFGQQNLRNRVSYTLYKSTQQATAEHTAYYSYDIHGNVKRFGREIGALNNSLTDQGLKVTNYYYDLVSGKVNYVVYQQGFVDQYIHAYEYDQENRLINVLTGHRPELMETDASYQYYLHGPLARVELGSHLIQGVDYAYTINGWLKAVNSGTLDSKRDMGKDGYSSGNTNIHQSFAQDAFGFVLDYFENDYTPTNNTADFNSFIPKHATGSLLKATKPNLYNGNIGAMTTAISAFMENGKAPLASAYSYDQLNRLAEASYFNNINLTENEWQQTGAVLEDYYNKFVYDANGNIVKQERNGSRILGVDMDDLSYEYYENTNRLKRVTDLVTNVAYMDDIDNQVSGNYQYDQIGNLIADKTEEISEIQWNVYGKISQIIREPWSSKPDLQFEYTPDGHRAVKIVIPKTGGYTSYTYYVRDAQGNIMATYTRNTNKIIDYTRLTYADVNAKLQSLVGATALSGFIANVHSTSVVNAAFNNFLLTTMANNTAALESRVKEFTLYQILHGTDPKYLQWLLTNVDGRVMLEQVFSQGIIDVKGYVSELCNCTATGTNTSLTDVIIQNPEYLAAFIDGLCLYDQAKANAVQIAIFGNKSCPISGTQLNWLNTNLSPTSGSYHSKIATIRQAFVDNDLISCEHLSSTLSEAYHGVPGGHDIVLKLLSNMPQNQANSKIANMCQCGNFSMSNMASSTYLHDFLLALYKLNINDYIALTNALSISNDPANLFNDLQSVNPQDVVDELANLGIESCNEIFNEILVQMHHRNPQLLNDFIGQSFTGVNYSSACISDVDAYTCPTTESYLSDLTAFYAPNDIWNNLLQIEAPAYYAAWYKNNALPEFLRVATKYHLSDITTYQQNNNMYGATPNGMYEYFNLIKTNLGATVHNNMVSHFMGLSNTFMDSIHLNEWMLYGSSRLGSKDVKIVTAAIKLDALANGPNLSEQSYFEDNPDLLTISETNSEFWRGQKRYELSNHLGNVLSVVSDKKTAVYTNTQTPTFSHYSAEVIQATDYSPFGAPLPSRSYTYNKFDKVVVDLYPNNMNLAGWQTIFCTNPNSCVSPETSVTLTESAGKLKIEATKRYSQAYYTFTTVPGRVYRVKYKLSNSTILMVNTSLFAPVSKTELYTSANVTTFDVDREMIFTATETSTRFYITKGWSASSTTPLQEITLDYLTIVEIPSQTNYISCTSLNQNLTMLSNSGVNINDSNAVKGYLNVYYNAQFSYFAYQQVISNCATFAGSYVLPRKGTEADFVESAYRFSFNGMPKDDEVYGEGNAYDFGARMYSSRLGKWLAVDPKAAKYVSLSPYHFGNNNPIITIDPNGEENIVVIGGPGGHNNVYNFAESAIKQGKAYQAEKNAEKTTLVIMNIGYSPEQIDEITKIAAANGLGSPVIINNATELVSYINSGSTQSGIPTAVSQERINDPVTDLAVFGHGTPSGGLELGYGTDQAIQGAFGSDDALRLSPIAFGSETNGDAPQIDLYTCNGARVPVTANISLAQTLNNQTGAGVKAFDGQTDYHHINDGNKKKDGQMAPNGATNLPVASTSPEVATEVNLPAKR